MNKQRLDFKSHWPQSRKGHRSKFEKKAQHFGNLSSHFFHKQTLSTLFLLFGTLIAIIWASFPAFSSQYDTFTNLLIGVQISDYSFKKPLTFWVNDILICLFFFLVGLEIKKEILVGKLNKPKLALFAVFGGLGGMVVPALLFFIANYQTDFASAWGIPMATDTAIVLSILIFFKDKLPQGLFAFLATLAIIDDIGAIVVIAIFYTQSIDVMMLLYSGMLILTLVLLNLAGVRQAMVYFVLGFLLWTCVELAGFHGTLAGLMVALAIPARPVNKSKVFVKRAKRILHELDAHTQKEDQVLKHEIHHELLEHMRHYTQQASTPLQKWENQLERPIFLVILPLFALVNAGIPVSKDLFCHMFTNTLSLGIILGLVVGKPLGIVSFCWTALKTNIGEMPEGSNFRHILGVSALSGIGFTMSIFITNQCVDSDMMILQAKASVMVASITSAFLAIFCMKRIIKQ